MKVELSTHPLSRANQLMVDALFPASGVSRDELHRAAYCAHVSPMQPIDKLFAQEFQPQSLRSHAINYFRNQTISGAVWHHASEYHITVKGPASDILQRCDLSQTMREKLLLDSIKRSMRGREVIAIAASGQKTQPGSLDVVRRLNFLGFVVIKPTTA